MSRGRTSAATFAAAAGSSLITAATTMFGGLLEWSRVLYSGPFPLIHIHRPASLAVAATPLVVTTLCYRKWLVMGRAGAGSPWAIAVGVCLAVIVVGSSATTLLGALDLVMQLRGIRGLWQYNTVILNWTALPELLVLLILPWLLRFMPGAPAATPASPEPRRTPPREPNQPTRAAFGRRGAV